MSGSTGAAEPAPSFNFGLISFFGMTPDGKVKLEVMTPPPLFTADDHWWFATIAAQRDGVTGLTSDPAPPYAAYAANANQTTPLGSPFAAPLFQDRRYSPRCAKR